MPAAKKKVKRRSSALSKDAYQSAVDVLIKAREAKKLSQRQVSARLDVPASYISKIESRERRVDIAELVLLCRALKVSPVTLMKKIADAIPEDAAP